MSLKHKNMQLRQKSYCEQQLKDRLALLAGRGIEGKKVDRDPIVRKLKASVKALNGRLRAIADSEKLVQDLAKSKADKAAAAFKDKEEQRSGKSGEAGEGGEARKRRERRKAQEGKGRRRGQGKEAQARKESRSQARRRVKL
jgi:hypothetical protein